MIRSLYFGELMNFHTWRLPANRMHAAQRTRSSYRRRKI